MSGYSVRRAGPSVTDCIAAAMRADPALTLEQAIVTVPICQRTIDEASARFTDPGDICWQIGAPGPDNTHAC